MIIKLSLQSLQIKFYWVLSLQWHAHLCIRFHVQNSNLTRLCDKNKYTECLMNNNQSQLLTKEKFLPSSFGELGKTVTFPSIFTCQKLILVSGIKTTSYRPTGNVKVFQQSMMAADCSWYSKPKHVTAFSFAYSGAGDLWICTILRHLFWIW